MPSANERSREVLESVEGDRGVAREWVRILAERDPDLLEKLHGSLMHVVTTRDSIPRKYKELVMISLNAASFYEYGVRLHTRTALQHGATEDELLEALEIVSLTNLHGMTSMLPSMFEEIAHFKKDRTDN
ncbi:AhpD family alkylhydroperoxidase [Burkholderia sp. OAS925]|uniref:carboxymuconolactone decarboxylase family protein n=1 Tax=Paraburkholderia TaxID=1822464 RepID=UPI00178AD238|nr:carboxymuconolactone decarboxylase family protein [Paraburkholderia graminis]MDR6478869.1 AhpD family alkylhydroperoxidase [Paraburkholderia graminis]